jgi:hypothetical protein
MFVDPMSATDLTGRNLLHCCGSSEAVSQVYSSLCVQIEFVPVCVSKSNLFQFVVQIEFIRHQRVSLCCRFFLGAKIVLRPSMLQTLLDVLPYCPCRTRPSFVHLSAALAQQAFAPAIEVA